MAKRKRLTNWIKWVDFYDLYFPEYREAVCEIAYRAFQRGCWPKHLLVIKISQDDWDVLVESDWLRTTDGRPILRYAEHVETVKQQTKGFEDALSNSRVIRQEPARRLDRGSARNASPDQRMLFD